MLKLPIPEAIHKIAQERADAMPVLRGSHRGKAGNEVGCLGEVIVEGLLKVLEVQFDFEGATSHDLRVGDELWEVKTKDRTVVPMGFYDCSVPLYNHEHQDVNRYVFVSLLRRGDETLGVKRFPIAFVLGMASREEIFKSGRTWKAGEVDPSNGTKFWTDCVNLPIAKLTPFLDFIDTWQTNEAHSRYELL
jgi:hypothetical protein